MAAVLGVDFGTKRIGLAIGSEEQKIALPYDVLILSDRLIGELRRIIDTEQVYRIIVGLPIGLNGQMTDKTHEAEKFIDLLKQNFNLPILTEDERLTSKEADQLFKTYQKKYPRDAIAAMLILQGYLDKLK